MPSGVVSKWFDLIRKYQHLCNGSLRNVPGYGLHEYPTNAYTFHFQY